MGIVLAENNIYSRLQRYDYFPVHKTRENLSRPQLFQLAYTGFCFHTFRNQRSLMFTVRTTRHGKSYDISITAIDLLRKKIAGYADIEVCKGQDARMWGQMRELPDFSRATKLMLRIYGFRKEEIERLASVVREKDADGAAYWIHPVYRRKNAGDYKELFQVLMNTAFYFAKGLIVNRLEIRGVGGRNQTAREKLFRHLSKEFGAEITDRVAGNMIIEL